MWLSLPYTVTTWYMTFDLRNTNSEKKNISHFDQTHEVDTCKLDVVFTSMLRRGVSVAS